MHKISFSQFQSTNSYEKIQYYFIMMYATKHSSQYYILPSNGVHWEYLLKETASKAGISNINTYVCWFSIARSFNILAWQYLAVSDSIVISPEEGWNINIPILKYTQIKLWEWMFIVNIPNVRETNCGVHYSICFDFVHCGLGVVTHYILYTLLLSEPIKMFQILAGIT